MSKRLARLAVLGQTALESGWLTIERQRLQNHYTDGTSSAPFEADSAHRRGVDAVAVLPWRRVDGAVQVCLLQVLRPGVALRARLDPPVPDDGPDRPMLWEAPAGIPEADERGEEGLRRCGAREVLEETGIPVPVDAVTRLGAGTYPSGGILAEMLHLYAAEVPAEVAVKPAEGDGTPFEEPGDWRWWDLGEALAACEAGVIADSKTEISLGRLARRLGHFG